MSISEFHKNRIKLWLNSPLPVAESNCPFQSEWQNYGSEDDMEICHELFPELKETIRIYKYVPGKCHSVCPCSVFETDHIISVAQNAIDTK